MIRFGPFTLDAARCELRRDGKLLPVERKAFEVLQHLIEHRERVISKQELLAHVWAGVSVSPNSAHRAAVILRKVLQDDARQPRWLTRVHGRGGRFIGELREPEVASETDPEVTTDYRRRLLGRSRERELLRAAMHDAVEGRGGVLLHTLSQQVPRTKGDTERLPPKRRSVISPAGIRPLGDCTCPT